MIAFRTGLVVLILLGTGCGSGERSEKSERSRGALASTGEQGEVQSTTHGTTARAAAGDPNPQPIERESSPGSFASLPLPRPVSERDVLTRDGAIGPAATDVLRGESFRGFIDELRRGASDPKLRALAEVYRQAVEQTLSEIPGAVPPVAFECGVAVCAGVLETEGSPDWLRAWQSGLMADQLAPVKTMGIHQVTRGDGTVESRFVLATQGPGKVSQDL